MFREGTSKQSSDSYTEQEQRSKKSSYENGSLKKLRDRHYRFHRPHRSAYDNDLSSSSTHPETLSQTEERQRGLSRSLSDSAISSSRANHVGTLEWEDLRYENHSLLHAQDDQLLVSGSTELHEPLEARLDHRPQVSSQDFGEPSPMSFRHDASVPNSPMGQPQILEIIRFQPELEEEQHPLLEQHDLHQREQQSQERQDQWELCLPLDQFFRQWQQRFQQDWQEFMPPAESNFSQAAEAASVGCGVCAK